MFERIIAVAVIDVDFIAYQRHKVLLNLLLSIQQKTLFLQSFEAVRYSSIPENGGGGVVFFLLLRFCSFRFRWEEYLLILSLNWVLNYYVRFSSSGIEINLR